MPRSFPAAVRFAQSGREREHGAVSNQEAPEPDMAEQQQAVVDTEEGDAIERAERVVRDRPVEANPADVLEQEEDVPLDDDYR
jgi:hypothetical protein